MFLGIFRRLLKHLHKVENPNIIDYAFYISELSKANPSGMRNFSWLMDWSIPNDNWYNSYSDKDEIFKDLMARNQNFNKANGNL